MRPSAVRRWGLLWCTLQRNPPQAHRGHGHSDTVHIHGRQWECPLLEEWMSERVRSHPRVQVEVRSKDEMCTDGSTNASLKDSTVGKRKTGLLNTGARGKLNIHANETVVLYKNKQKVPGNSSRWQGKQWSVSIKGTLTKIW